MWVCGGCRPIPGGSTLPPRTPLIPTKGDDRRKIDGGLADILAYWAAMTMPESRPFRSAYEDGGLTFTGT